MKFYYVALCLSILFINQSFAQQKKRVVILADISNYTDTLPVSNYKKWLGNDTLVSGWANGKVSASNIMNAEYLIFPSLLNGDSLNPNNDALEIHNISRIRANINNKLYTWTFETEKPLEVSNASLLGGVHLVFPGDSIYISYKEGDYIFSGRGAERFRFVDAIKRARESVVMKDTTGVPLNIERFLKRNQYLNEQWIKAMQVLEANRSKISLYEYNWVKGKTLSTIEPVRQLYFSFIANPALEKYKNQTFDYTTDDLVRIWDSTMYKPESHWWHSDEVQNINGVGTPATIESFYILEARRGINFQNSDIDSFKNIAVYKKLMYQKIKANYSGLFQERLLCYFINEEIIQEIGSHSWFAQSILRDYYSIPGFPAYKKWMKERESEQRYANPGIPLFKLEDNQGRSFSNRNTKGKSAIISFWYSGCEPCREQSANLAKLQEKLKEDTSIIFLHVSVDADRQQWQKSIKEGKYVPKKGIQLWTGGLGKNHEMIRDFDIISFPTVRIFDEEEQILIDKANPYATTFSAEHLRAIVTRKTSQFQDGPYVFYEQGTKKAVHIDYNKVEGLKSVNRLAAFTENYDHKFQFSLQKNIKSQPSVYPAVSKMLVFSDIEGNFGPLRKLLQNNQVIDDDFNWVFGKGHLVFAGDMFDRGEQVTECLWLIYSLEEKAKAAGGKVHFILGNHEIMNLHGDDRYARSKYKRSAKLMGKEFKDLYNEESELGRWLRTKNIVEKIGDNLFCHGGISPAINSMSITLEGVNQKARPYYDKAGSVIKKSNDEQLKVLYNTYNSPFWYRHYYVEDHFSKSQNMLVRHASESQIDSTCEKFGVSRIITGHSIVADTISVHYGGKVINTDTKHAHDKSEALLIEGDYFYRVNAEGKKILLFIDDRRKRPKIK